MTETPNNTPLTKRERLTILLVLFLVQLISPMHFSHKLEAVLTEIKQELAS